MKRDKLQINYIELFSGIGAFTQAIETLDYINAKCVFAADIDANCSSVYKSNYGVDSLCDITKKDENSIPKHNFCFFSPPCQAFSKSGKQKGFEDARGTLIYDVFRILNKHKPKYILMENVRNLVSHDNGNTIDIINSTLKKIGYRIPEKPIILSPHYFGVPQTRDRAFIAGIYDPINSEKPLNINFDRFYAKNECNIYDIVDHKFDNDKSLIITQHEKNLLNMWDEFYHLLDVTTIGFPIWYDYFFDKNIESNMPEWKKDFIRKNKELYIRNKKKIDKWCKKHNYLQNYNATERKFEWQAGNNIESIWEGIIQIRPSGIRVKSPTTSPALVALVQIPIIGKLKRRLSVRECANLQSFSKDFIPSDKQFVAYKQLGNSINVTVLARILDKLFSYND